MPNGGHIGFSPVSAPDGRDALRQFEMVRRRGRRVRARTTPRSSSSGCARCTTSALLLFDTANPTRGRRPADLARVLVDEAAAEGYGEYRTHNALMDHVMATFDWGDGALLRFHETIKDALDPNGIIAPGKSGVWPARYRDQGL